MPDPPPKPEIPRSRFLPGRRASWVALIFAIAGLGLVPWTLYLAVALPSRHVQQGGYDIAWTGFDVALAALLTATALGVLWRRVWLQGVAAAAALMLLVDAWFDVLSSHSGSERLQAILLAGFAELPSAAICFALAYHVEAATEGSVLSERSARRKLGR